MFGPRFQAPEVGLVEDQRVIRAVAHAAQKLLKLLVSTSL